MYASPSTFIVSLVRQRWRGLGPTGSAVVLINSSGEYRILFISFIPFYPVLLNLTIRVLGKEDIYLPYLSVGLLITCIKKILLPPLLF